MAKSIFGGGFPMILVNEPPSEPARWGAEIYYRTEAGSIIYYVEMAELTELAEQVESGPHWDTIIKIEIVRIGQMIGDLTLERSQLL